MGTIPTSGFHNGRFHQGGQGTLDERRGADAGNVTDFDKMSKDALVSLAKERGVAHDANATKAQIADAIRAAEAG